MKPVGILGGMGPEATILLQQRLLAVVDAQDDADHLPLLIDMNPQVPSRIAHLIERTGPDPSPVLAEMAQRLQAGGATALAMPCNTAHHYAPAITRAADIPLLNMVDLSVGRAEPDARVGVLGSPALRLAGVFDEPMARSGVTAIWPSDMDALLQTIRAIKRHGATPDAHATLTTAIDDLTRQGADLILIACSEFSLLTPDLTGPVPLLDTVDVLAEAIRDHIKS